MIANTETSSKGKGHSEPITSLHWILDPDGKTYNVGIKIKSILANLTKNKQ